jgi:opacity protein-like surface antigen
MVRSGANHWGVLAGLAVVLISGMALAQAAPAAPAAPAAGGSSAGGIKTTGGPPTGKDSGYGYEFTDDPLNAGGFGPNDATIRVRPGPVRTTLIRPRTSFVPEMLKSVENL